MPRRRLLRERPFSTQPTRWRTSAFRCATEAGLGERAAGCYGHAVLVAVFRILRDVIVYRIRKREMANLASSLTIMLAIGLSFEDAAIRFAFAIALNIAVYLTNDIYDVRADLVSAGKDTKKAAYLRDHLASGWVAVLAPVAVMAGIALTWNRELLVTLVAAAGVCWAYSARFKRVPFVDLPTIFVCGVAGSMVAFPLNHMLGWCLAGLLGLFAACFQTVQMVRDHDDDAAFGTQTTAVALGPKATIMLQRVLLIAAAVYASLMLHRWIGLAIALTVLLPFRADQANLYWNRIRVALGISWLAIVTWLIASESSHGWLLQLERSRTFPW